MYKPYVIKKNVHLMIERPVYKYIDEQSIHHNGLMDITIRLAELAGNQLQSGKAKYLDIVLSQAIANWSIHVNRAGISVAYKEFCQVVFDSLPEIFDYTVTGKSKVIPFYDQTWDCTSKTYFEWLITHNVDADKVCIRHTPAKHTLNRLSASFILSSKVFTRHDMVNLGLASEIHMHVGG